MRTLPIPSLTATEIRKFRDRIITNGPIPPHCPELGSCWLWRGCKDDKGYGKVGFGGLILLAHRVSWVLKKGRIPKGLWVLHRCDNPSCVRPTHLFLGTRSDNMRDCSHKQRIKIPLLKGSRHPTSPFTCSQVEFVRTVVKEGFAQAEVARYFGVCPATINHIIKGRNWANG